MQTFVEENQILNLERLNNNYYALRHGESMANASNLVVSDPEIGVLQYGLTEKGKNQVEKIAKEAVEIDKSAIVVSSDFLRASETAKIFADVRNVESIQISTVLRERFFGDFDMGAATEYLKVWEEDNKDYHQKKYNVESVGEVLVRTTGLILSLEKKYHNRKIVLVAHGDTLQILETGFRKMDPSKHRTLEILRNAELRELNLN